MLPSEKFSVTFTPKQRTLGEEFRSGAERLWGGDECIVCDFSQGKGCHTELELVDGRLRGSCNCGHFQSHIPCAHVWAALLVADEFQDLAKALKRNVPRRVLPKYKDGPGGTVYESRRPAPKPEVTAEDGRIIQREDVPLRKKRQKPLPGPVTDLTLNHEILYVLRPEKQRGSVEYIVLETWWRPTLIGEDGRRKIHPFVLEQGSLVPTEEDASLLEYLAYRKVQPPASPNQYLVPAGEERIFSALARVAYVRWTDNSSGNIKMHPLELRRSEPAEIELEMKERPDGRYSFSVSLLTKEGEISFDDVKLIAEPRQNREKNLAGYALASSVLFPVRFLGAAAILEKYTGNGNAILDASGAALLVKRLAMESNVNLEDFPESIGISKIKGQPAGELYIRTALYKYKEQEQLHVQLSFNYDGIICSDDDSDRVEDGRQVILRDREAEEALRTRMRGLGFRMAVKAYLEEPGWKLLPSLLDNAVMELTSENWVVRAEGKTYRRPKMKKAVAVPSGIDWFSIKGGVDFDGIEVSVPELLAAYKKGQKSVRLDDGTYGLLPLEWLADFTVLTEIGDVCDGKLRFRVEQAALVKAILEDRLEEAGDTLRKHLAALEELARPEPAQAPPDFRAVLRPYQETGLGWLLAMQKAGLGGCLADDMGLGKTIQVLALLALRAGGADRKPSLVVLPSSLVFNWTSEAGKFAPQLRLKTHWGPGRDCRPRAFRGYDIVLTTYGTLRNDAAKLAEVDFDYCILDESQAIKNYDSSTARAARCIKARYRIAMTGTPVENNLGELFSQLDFLNPGLFGAGSAYAARRAKPEQISRICSGVRPFILRRTKQQVAKELPPKSEQILWCEMTPEAQAEYDELLTYYQKTIKENGGPQNNGMQTLAALTRLRQAACHPGLLKPDRNKESSAKLELLMSSLDTLLSAGHKVLVFSQFTSFLHIIKSSLEERNYGYSYLDGQTKDRDAEVNAFQKESGRLVFLISLKAGGVGLNLTAADYVFIMDPWWNPASEAQAIDRAYRIGQLRPVTAYRIVAKNTIEEKVLQLQNTKRELASSVVDGGDGMPVKITKQDLELLLGGF